MYAHDGEYVGYQYTTPNEGREGDVCDVDNDCWSKDINMLCRSGSEGNKTCKCRRDMRWNEKALECQLFIDVDCSSFDQADTPSPEVKKAGEELVYRLRGYSTEEDKMRKLIAYWRKVNAGIVWALTDEEIEKLYNEGPTSICITLLQDYSLSCAAFGEYTEEARWRKILSPLKAKEREIPRDRTENPEEALHDTLLSTLTNSNNTNVSGEVLHEAFCRDMEAFSDVFLEDFVPLTTTTTTSTTTRPTTTTDYTSREEAIRGEDAPINGRPPTCPTLPSSSCAVLFDSSSCAAGSWRLTIPPDSQKRFLYWSSDYKYRNDADIVGVREGCMFTGWTGVSYDGERIVLDAHQNDFWVVFARWPQYENFHENILSFQCNCQ